MGDYNELVDRVTEFIYTEDGSLKNRVVTYNSRYVEDDRDYYKAITITEDQTVFKYLGYEKDVYTSKVESKKILNGEYKDGSFIPLNNSNGELFYSDIVYKNVKDNDRAPDYPYDTKVEISKQYDMQGNLISKWTTSSFRLLTRKKPYEKIEDGKRVLVLGTVDTPLKVTYENIVDEYGNWVKRIGRNENGSPESIAFRTIKYFN